MLPAEAAVLLHFKPLGRLLLVLGRAVVPAFALAAGHLNNVAHF